MALAAFLAAAPARQAPQAVSSDAAALVQVRQARARSGLTSSLPEAQLDASLARLLQWVQRSYAASGPRALLPDAPEATNGAGASNARLQALQQTYWLQDNALYGEGALAAYDPPLAAALGRSWRLAWDRTFPRLCPDTQSGYAIGRPAPYDLDAKPADARCRLPRPGAWQYFRMHQYPEPKDPGFDALPRPIIGTDHPVDANGQTQMAAIRNDAVRDLLKYGCLRQATLGNRELAGQMFDLALAQWDGHGFVNANRRASAGSGLYWTRDLAFALMCANAIGRGQGARLGANVTKADVEQRLWKAQAGSGGVWTNYCEGPQCAAYIPATAKLTNEIAPLVLLAYGPNVWTKSR